jgi:hypothetical protein
MTFSSDEIDAEVSQIVQGAHTFKRDGLGGRNVKERFEETRELVNSVMLYEPDSVYYLIQKAVIRTRFLLKTTLSVIDDMEDDLDGMAVPSRAVPDTTALADAGNALNTIANALTRRGSISNAEYQRYERATNRALDTYKQSAKRTYTPFSGTQAVTDVVKASAEAATSLRTNFNTLKSSYATLLAAVDRLLGGFDNYSHDTIVQAVASRQMSRIKTELDSLESNFSSRTPDQRSQTARADTLSILTNKASVKALSRIRYPGEPKLQQSSTASAVYRASAYGTGSPPAIVGDISGPWPITDSHELEIDFGGTPVNVDLTPNASSVPGIKPATLTGAMSDSGGAAFAINESLGTPWPLMTYEIGPGTSYPVTGTFLYIVVDGVLHKVTDDRTGPPYSAFSGVRTPAELATDIEFHVPVLDADGWVDGGTGNEWVKINYNNVTSPPGTYSNRYIQIATGPNNASTFDGSWRVDVGGTKTTAGTPTAGSVTRGWDGNDELWVWLDALTEATAIKLDLENGSWPDYIVSAVDLRDKINTDVGGTMASVSSGRLVLTSPVSGEGSVVKIITEGLDVSGKKYPSTLGAETLGFYGDQESRESDFSAQALVDVLNANADFSAKAVASLVKTSLFSGKEAYVYDPDEVRVPSLADISGGPSTMKLVIESGENRGTYSIGNYGFGPSWTQFQLGRNLRDPSATGFRVNVYTEHLRIEALDAGTGSYIDVDESHGTTAHAVLGLPEDRAYGTVEQLWVERNDPAKGWVAANLNGLGIKIGDVILLEDRTTVATVTGIDSLSLGIIDITPVLPTTSLTAFSIESVAYDNHAEFISTLRTWRDALSTDEENLTSLEKAVSYLLRVKNPDRGRVQVAATELQTIRDNLDGASALNDILVSFSTPVIPAVDRALDVMTQEGQDRARDLLTSAQFREYHKSNYKTSSTSGAMMDAASKVAAEDLVEPTRTQPEFAGEIDKLIVSTWDEVDPKYNFGDIKAESAPVYLDYFSTEIPGGSK